MAENLGVLHDAKFSFGNEIAGFIKYMDDETKTNQEVANLNFGSFLGYMDNPNKSSGLFDETCSYISKERRSDYVEYFKVAQERETIFWQDLFSFDNEWLEEYGLMDTKTNEVDDTRLMNAVKAAMDTLIKMEGLQDYKWIGAMHHNTEHRHFHVAGVELHPSRLWKWHNVYKKDYRGRYVLDEKGKKIATGNKVFEPTGVRKKETLKKIKSVFVNQLIQSAEQLKAIDQIARKEIVGSMKAAKAFQKESQSEKELLVNLYLKLPKDKRLWNMKNAKPNFFGKEVQALVESKFKGQFNHSFLSWEQKMLAQSQEYEKAYKNIEIKDAPITDPDIQKYFLDKKDRLYYDAGNAVLSQLKNLDKERQSVGLNRKAFIASLNLSTDTPVLVKEVQKVQQAINDGLLFTDNDVPPVFSFEAMDPRVEPSPKIENPPTQKGKSELLHERRSFDFKPMAKLDKTNNRSPYTQQEVDLALSALVYKQSVEEPEKIKNPPTQKGETTSPWHVVNVYVEEEQIRVLTNSDVARMDVQKKYKVEEGYTKTTNGWTEKSRELRWGKQKFIEGRRNAAKFNTTLRKIDRNMKKSANRWREEMDYDYLEQQILREGKHSLSY
ncbi:MobP2 family relaxase [Listeria seeligeri]|uniref:MobP2 family relaxase n=1 Tax=Listeria seeligeri TaxID=1640 RepID=UPI0022EADF46|nr:MobP2 family relaxase [Listeria seeligeri]